MGVRSIFGGPSLPPGKELGRGEGIPKHDRKPIEINNVFLNPGEISQGPLALWRQVARQSQLPFPGLPPGLVRGSRARLAFLLWSRLAFLSRFFDILLSVVFVVGSTSS